MGKLWKDEAFPQEKPYPLIEQKVFDRDNNVYEILPKKDYFEAMIEAFGDEKPDMKMGERQVKATEKERQSDEESPLEIIFTR